MDDEGFDNFELVRDLFASSNIMKDQHQTLVDFKDKMLQLQSKSAYSISYTQDGQDMVFHALTEEFFVNLMFPNLSKKYDTAKIEYTYSVSSGKLGETVGLSLRRLEAERLSYTQSLQPWLICGWYT
jgi:hypothetical protein